MPTTPHPLQGKLSFNEIPNSVNDAELHLHLTATEPAKLVSELRLGGSLTLRFVHHETGADAGELTYDYKVVGNNGKLDLDPRLENTKFPLCKHTQVARNPVNIDGQVVEVAWELREWHQLGTFHVEGMMVTRGGEVKAEFLTDSFTVAAAVPTSGGGTPPGPTVPVPTEPASSGPVAPFPLPLPVTLQQADRVASNDQLLWGLIRRRVVSFNRYRNFIDNVLCDQSNPLGDAARRNVAARQLPFTRSASYAMLKHATEYYLMQEAGLAPVASPFDPGFSNIDDDDFSGPNETRRTAGSPFSLESLRKNYLKELGDEVAGVPYFKTIREKLAEVPLKSADDVLSGGLLSYGILKSRVMGAPLMELIWSYWHEEGGLVQTMNALSLRFQNVRRPGPGPDPLANLAIDPLRPLNNIIWGYIEDERNRLTMNRRNLEYQYEYGFGLIGRGVQNIAVAEHRTFFLRGFHSLLRACTEFYQQANFTTVIPDGFPILNHLREVHLTLAEGAHNQYGDLPWTARAEMLTQQYILARPEVREFLGGRIMVPYTEPWMDRVDNMKSLQGWNPTNITHFRDLGAFGEQLLLSIRYGAWNSSTVGATSAANWAHYWREEIQRYIHAYKAVTGIDLATDLGDIRQNLPDNEERYLQPAQLIERQNAIQQGQLRRNRQLNPPAPALRPMLNAAPRRRLEE